MSLAPKDMVIRVSVNGTPDEREISSRLTLADYLRDELGLTGTHVGCEQGICGACTVILDGRTVRSCLMLAAQADEASVMTVEGLAAGGDLGVLQRAFADHDALQCGFCTPGMLMTCTEIVATDGLTDADIAELLSGNLCRCTGYVGILKACKEVYRSTHHDTSRQLRSA
jgi:carbon-monoxide dehydrogenase small subunit